MKKLALFSVIFVALISVFIFQHEWLHQDVAESYGCEASQVNLLSLEDLDDFRLAELPVAYVTWSCENSEDRKQVQQLQMIVEIVGYQLLLVFIMVAALFVLGLYESSRFSKSLNRIEKGHALILEELDIDPDQLRGENHR